MAERRLYLRASSPLPSVFLRDCTCSYQRVTGDPTLYKFLRDNFLVDMRNVTAGRLLVFHIGPHHGSDIPAAGHS